MIKKLRGNAAYDIIIDELNAIQGRAVDLGGYYFPDEEKASSAMRPIDAFNDILKHI